MNRLAKKLLAPLGRALAGLVPSRHRDHYTGAGRNVGLASTLSADVLLGAVQSAENGDTQSLFAIYSEMVSTDNFIQSLLDSRKRAALKDAIKFVPRDKDNPLDVTAATKAEMLFDGYNPDDCELDDWQLALGALMDSVVWPKTILSKRFSPSTRDGLRYDLQGLKFVDYQLFDWTQRRLMIADTDEEFGNRLGTFHAPDPAQYMLHQGHLQTSGLNRGGPMRSLLFWWLFASMNRDWWARFLDRFGAPFLLGKFNDGDDEGRAILENAFAASSKLLGVVVSNETDVEIAQASGGNATGEAFEKFRNVARREMAILICGQNLSSESGGGGGLGDGTASLQGDVRDEMKEFDQARLGFTLKRLVRQFLAINGYGGQIEVTFGGKKALDLVQLGNAVSAFKAGGIIVSDESLGDLSADVGYTMVRDTSASPPPTPPIITLSADPGDSESANAQAIQQASTKLARLMRETLSPIRTLLAESQSAADLEERLAAFIAPLSLEDRSKVTEDLCLALTVNGLE